MLRGHSRCTDSKSRRRTRTCLLRPFPSQPRCPSCRPRGWTDRSSSRGGERGRRESSGALRRTGQTCVTNMSINQNKNCLQISQEMRSLFCLLTTATTASSRSIAVTWRLCTSRRVWLTCRGASARKDTRLEPPL